MTRGSGRILRLLLIFVLGAVPLFAQETTQPGTAAPAPTPSAETQPAEPPSADAEKTVPPAETPEASEEPAASSDQIGQPEAEENNDNDEEEGIAALLPAWSSIEQRMFVLYGANTDGVYATVRENNMRAHGWFAFFSPYVALALRTHKTVLSVRFSPAINYSSRLDSVVVSSTLGALENSGLSLNMQLSRGLVWRTIAYADCGEGEIRLWNALNSAQAEQTALDSMNPGAMVQFSTQGSACDFVGSTGFILHRWRQEIDLSFGEAYSTRIGLHSYGLGLLRLGITHHLTPAISLKAFARVQESFLNGNPTEAFFAGAEVKKHLSRRVEWVGQAGPEIDNFNYGWKLGAIFSSTLNATLTERMSASVRAERELSPAYAFGSRWADFYAARFRYARLKNYFQVDAGHLQFSGGGAHPFGSYYVSPAYHRRLERSLELVFNYTRYVESPPDISKNAISVGLHWHPNAESLRRVLALPQ